MFIECTLNKIYIYKDMIVNKQKRKYRINSKKYDKVEQTDISDTRLYIYMIKHYVLYFLLLHLLKVQDLIMV